MSRFDWTQLVTHTSLVTPLLIIGVTLFLAIGCVLIWLTRSPVHRQRWGELTLIGAFIWSLFAIIPLPRLLTGVQIAPPSPTPADHVRTAPLSPTKAAKSDSRRSHLSATNDGAEFLTSVDVNTLPEPDVRPPLQAAPLSAGVHPSSSSHRPAAGDPVPSMQSDAQVDVPWALEAGPFATETTSTATPLATAEVSRPESVPPISTLPVTRRLSLSTPWIMRLLWIYLLGSLVCVSWLLIGQILLGRVYSQRLDIEPWLTEVFEHVVPRDTDRRLRLIVSPHCGRALSWGVWHPVIVLPVSLCRRGNECQIRTVLLHELGHVAQRDAWSNLLICVTMPVLYLHPLFWWMRMQMRLSAELLADDWAAQQTGKTQYVEELVALAKVTTGRGILLPGVTGLFSSPSQFYRRMNMLLTREEPLATRPTWTWRCLSLGSWATVVAFAVAVAGISPVVGQQEAASEAPAVQTTAGEAAPAEKPVEPKVEAPGVIVVQPGTDLPARLQSGGRGVPPVPATGVVAVDQQSNEVLQLIADLQKIQAKLRSLGIEAPVPAPSAWTAGTNVTSARIDENGHIIQETYTIGKDGKREKLVSRIDVGKMKDGKAAVHQFIYGKDGLKPVEQPEGVPAGAVPRLPDGRVLTLPSGVTVIDSNSVKAELKSATQPGNQPNYTAVGEGLITVVPQGPVSEDGKVATTLTPGKRTVIQAPNGVRAVATASEESTGTAGQQLDLVTLASSYADAVGAVESAKVVMDDIELANSKLAGTVTQREVTAARIALKNSERKEKLLRRIVTSALSHAEQEYNFAKDNHAKGYVPQSRLRSTEERLEVLRQILDTNSEATTAPAEVRKPEPEVRPQPSTSQPSM